MKRTLTWIVFAGFLALWLGACQTAPKSEAARDELRADAEKTVQIFKEKVKGIERFFDSSAGYAVFPSVGKAGLGVGGAYGKGVLYEDGKVVGYCDVSQGTFGFQLGAQAYREIIFFQTKDNLDAFKSNTFEFQAGASAVAVEAGAATHADYENGVAVFLMTKGGLMFEAAIGGQKFTFKPL